MLEGFSSRYVSSKSPSGILTTVLLILSTAALYSASGNVRLLSSFLDNDSLPIDGITVSIMAINVVQLSAVKGSSAGTSGRGVVVGNTPPIVLEAILLTRRDAIS